MTFKRSIFLARDGRYVTLGSGDAIELPIALLDAAAALDLRGWLAIMEGSPNHTRPPKLSRVHAVQGATDAQWCAAVSAFLAAHAARKQA